MLLKPLEKKHQTYCAPEFVIPSERDGLKGSLGVDYHERLLVGAWQLRVRARTRWNWIRGSRSGKRETLCFVSGTMGCLRFSGVLG